MKMLLCFFSDAIDAGALRPKPALAKRLLGAAPKRTAIRMATLTIA
jgi:hypothetical protein